MDVLLSLKLDGFRFVISFTPFLLVIPILNNFCVRRLAVKGVHHGRNIAPSLALLNELSAKHQDSGMHCA
jgi:hypothetical protein